MAIICFTFANPLAKHIGPNMPVDKQRLKKFKEQVRDQVVKDATAHVRLTPELMARLIERAEAEQLPYGVLVRQWIEDGLNTNSIGKRLDRIERLLKRKAN
jgi:hypothetical protein